MWVSTHKVDIGLRFAQDQEMCDSKGPGHCYAILERIFLSYLKIRKKDDHRHPLSEQTISLNCYALSCI